MNEFNSWLVGGGLVAGAVFAFMLQRFRFCLVAAISNLILIKDYRQALAFAAALLVAISGTQLLEILEVVAIADSSYRNSTLDWFGAVFGGFIFGIGATLAGGCAARTLVKTMEGSIHSLIALFAFILIASISQFGLLEPIRIQLTGYTAIELITDAGIASILSLPQWLVLLIVAASLLLIIYKSWQNCRDKTMLTVGLIIGALVVFSWYVTGSLAQDDFNPVKPSAMSLSGPLARIGYFFVTAQKPVLSFALSFVLATAVMSFLLALLSGQFKITTPARGMVKLALLGGSLMGLGAIMAYGCNIGQGLSGISTLSMESLLAITSMVMGVSVVTRWMEKYS